MEIIRRITDLDTKPKRNIKETQHRNISIRNEIYRNPLQLHQNTKRSGGIKSTEKLMELGM
jgi:hypothetical protein